MRKLRVSPFGKMTNGEAVGERKFDWKNCLIDASIMATISAVSTYTGVVGTLPEILAVRACAIAFVSAFFGFVAVKRGLIKEEKN